MICNCLFGKTKGNIYWFICIYVHLCVRHHIDSDLEKPGDAVFRQSFVWEERKKEMEREKGVDDGFCLSTNPTKRQLGAPTANYWCEDGCIEGQCQ